MKSCNSGFWVALGILVNFGGVLAQVAPPLNDNLSTARPLVGATVAFSGTVYGATTEPSEVLSEPWFTGSAWWSWTAPVSGHAALSVTGTPPASNGNWPELAVFRGSTWPAIQQGDWRPPILDVRAGFDVGFDTVAGEIYSFALMGDASTNITYQFSLMASNSPIVLGQPAGLIAHPGDSVYFTVRTPGRVSGGFQWQVNGQDMPLELIPAIPPFFSGEMDPTLALNNITEVNAGDYRVIVFGAPGTPNATSQVARLEIQGAAIPTVTRLFTAGVSNQFTLQLTGDARFSRQVEGSGDFTNWFPIRLNGFYRNAGLNLPLPATPTDTVLFYRTKQIGDFKQWCIANLQRIKFAKERAFIDHRRFPGSAVEVTDVNGYFGAFKNPICPSGGTYIYGDNGVDPTCSIEGHTL